MQRRAAFLISVGCAVIAVSIKLLLLNSHYDTENEGDNNSNNFMSELALSYFPDDIMNGGIEKTWFDRLAAHTMKGSNGRSSTIIVQVIDGQIYVDRSRFYTRYSWDRMRTMFILEQLRQILRKRSFPDFEFILVSKKFIYTNL